VATKRKLDRDDTEQELAIENDYDDYCEPSDTEEDEEF
jgi:hypothetical protein